MAPEINLFDLLADTLPHGAGIDCDWSFRMTTNGKVAASNSYHAMTEYGMYDGWADFTAYLVIAETGAVELDRVEFNGKDAAYLNAKHDLRGYLEDTIVFSLIA